MQGADDGLRDGIARENAKGQDKHSHDDLSGGGLADPVPRLYRHCAPLSTGSFEKIRQECDLLIIRYDLIL